jgi:hypothetical protein
VNSSSSRSLAKIENECLLFEGGWKKHRVNRGLQCSRAGCGSASLHQDSGVTSAIHRHHQDAPFQAHFTSLTFQDLSCDYAFLDITRSSSHSIDHARLREPPRQPQNAFCLANPVGPLGDGPALLLQELRRRLHRPGHAPLGPDLFRILRRAFSSDVYHR